jgi:hypothetical protein
MNLKKIKERKRVKYGVAFGINTSTCQISHFIIRSDQNMARILKYVYLFTVYFNFLFVVEL